MWCFALRVVVLLAGSLPPLAYAGCGPTGTEKVVIYSQGTTDPQNPGNCTLFNGPPSSLVNAARRKGYAVERLCDTWLGDQERRGSYVYHRADQFIAKIGECVRQGIPAKNIVLAGHSAGAWAALLALSGSRTEARAAVLFAPACCGTPHGPKHEKWKKVRKRQIADIGSWRKRRILVFAYDDDPYGNAQSLGFLPKAFPESMALQAYNCGFLGHYTYRFDCRWRATEAAIEAVLP
jgi:pimeloyl-ACP methyl ester carboxylesterase